MVTGEEGQNKCESKGFAGLSSLVSDVDTSIQPPARQEPKRTGNSNSSKAERPLDRECSKPKPQHKQNHHYQVSSKSSSGPSMGTWVLGIAAVIGVFWLIGEADKSPSSPSTSYSQPEPTQSTTPSNSTTSAQPQLPSRPDEAKPPVGQNLVFSMAQIRYCLAEDIRMDAAESALNNYSDSDVDRFNVMVSDYNSRCGSFRYRSGALERARADIEPYRSQLQAEGRRQFTLNQASGAVSAPEPSRLAADTIVRDVQQKLNELGYKAGPVDGLMGKRTRAAIMAFQQDRGLDVTGTADQDLLLQLQQASSSRKSESRSDSSSVKLSPGESVSLETACSTDKYVNVPVAYRACVERQKVALVSGVRRPNPGSWPSAVQQPIEAACSTDKYINGPAAHNRCLSQHLATFIN